MKPAFEVNEINSSLPILIVDKVGIVGEELAKELSKDFQILLVSGLINPPKDPKILNLYFKKRIPKVPSYKYSKIFLVDDGESVTRESAYSFIKLARGSSAPLFFIGSIRNTDLKHADSIAAEYTNSKVLIFGDLFDKNIFFDKEQAITKYILESRKTGRINVEGSGLNISYPMSFNDTIKLILKAVYLNIPQKIILLFYPHAYSDITLANIFQKVNPNIKVDFIKEKKKRNELYFPRNSQHAIGKYDLEKKIKELDLEDVENREIKIIKSSRGYKNNFIKPILFILLTFLFLLLLPFLTTSAYTLLGNREIKNAIKSFENGDFPKAKKQIENASSFYDTASKTSDSLITEASMFGFEKDALNIKKKITTGREVADASIELLDAVESISQIIGNKSTDPKNDFTKASASINNSITTFSKLKAEKALPKEIEEKLTNLEPFTNLIINSSEMLPDALGFEEEKRYLVIFQNNYEIRPSGGLIEYVGLLEVKNGKILSFDLKRSDDLDATQSINNEPPFEIRRYIPQRNLLLKDSGFEPDFIKSAISISNAYERLTKEKVDGVIAVDADFLKNVLQVTGPISINGKKLSAANFDSEFVNLSPVQYKDVINAIVNKINTENISSPSLAEEVGKSINTKNVVFAFVDPGLQNVFTVNSWSSSYWDNRQNSQGKVNDYFGLSEFNLSKNNSNYYVSRSVSKKVLVEDSGRISSVAEVVFRNTSKDINYKNYVRVALPEGTLIRKVIVDRVEQKIENPVTDFRVYESINFKPPAGLEVSESRELGKSIFGFLISVPANSTKIIDLEYELPFSVPSDTKEINYSLKIFKQPGVSPYPFDLNFEIPGNYLIINGKSNNLIDVNSDKTVNIDISQK